MATRENPTIVFLNREQTFRFSLKGLQPLTQHYFYFERRRVAATSIKPVGGKIGDPLMTDMSGMVQFDYYYDSGITEDTSPLANAQKQANLIGGVKEVALSTTLAASNTLPSNFMDTSLSYYIGHITINVFIPPESEFKEIKVTR
jgi:hypothetical protein